MRGRCRLCLEGCGVAACQKKKNAKRLGDFVQTVVPEKEPCQATVIGKEWQ